ncbi:hypothetical protein ACFXK0_08155 [Nocardia sp. NPDC059177]|uniref:hypothetical protein n=1 Tax=Nocardia sp. NPDC059177 TaxID=3346759 RepID=UPI0036B94243
MDTQIDAGVSCDPGDAPPDTAAADTTPPWAGPVLLASVLMFGFDLIALISLGDWMIRYGVVLVGGLYLAHVLACTGLAVWAVTRVAFFRILTSDY